jgi:endonuclease YncB( thermonuclease family)
MKNTLPKAIVLVAALLVTGAAAPATLLGEVVGVADGDTVTVLDSDRVQHRVRIAGIDAPEKRQAFGNRSRQHLASIVFRKNVAVEWTKTDRYGRIIGKVVVRELDAGLEQIRAGYAWHYKRYAREQVIRDRVAYDAAEQDARAHYRGLWEDLHPTPPWQFRRGS